MVPSQLLSIKNYAIWDSQAPALETNAREFTTIPVNLKRRCSHLTKIALETANRTAGSSQIDYAIFCSQHGELKAAIELLQNIGQQLPLSPAVFSQSVHNAVAGLFCIIHQLHINTISMAARTDTFFMGAIEAVAWLKSNPGKTVLLTIFDEQIPKEFRSSTTPADREYAVALLLTDKPTTQPEVTFTCDPNSTQNSTNNLPLALEFLEWYLTASAKELIQNTAHYTASWCKN